MCTAHPSDEMTTIAVTNPSTAEPLSLLLDVGYGVGGIFITVLLVYLLAYLNIVEASERSRVRIRSLLISVSLPLAVVFTGIITFASLSIIGVL